MKENLVLAVARRSGISAWRPDLKAKKLVDCSAQEWCKKLPQRAAPHLLQRGWLENRMTRLDADRVPVEPDWGASTLVKSVQDTTDLDSVASVLEAVPVS